MITSEVRIGNRIKYEGMVGNIINNIIQLHIEISKDWIIHANYRPDDVIEVLE